ncbi:MAG: class I SAM-dependent methyltransferase [Fimbriimonadaceae bacterium]|nr:class I SAM-dependent methyltransferase [Alphaproteobacteria bacterium]
MKLLSGLLRKFIRKGTLRVIDADGGEHVFSGTPDTPVAIIKIHDKSLYTKLFFNPELYLPEAYMDGMLTFEDGSSCYDFLYLFSINRSGLASHPFQAFLRKIWFKLRHFAQDNPVGQAFKHVHEHYDVSDELYRLFLDKEMQYTSAYYLTPEDSLEVAQANKMRHVCAKLKLGDGMKVAELGCGWGGLSRYLARTANVDIVAASLSENQVRVANELAKQEGVSDRVLFKHVDYRDLTGQYDRIVSIGMLEHLGRGIMTNFSPKSASC